MKARISPLSRMSKHEKDALIADVQTACTKQNRRNALRMFWIACVTLSRFGWRKKRLTDFYNAYAEQLTEFGIDTADNLDDDTGNVADYKLKRELTEIGMLQDGDDLFPDELKANQNGN